MGFGKVGGGTGHDSSGAWSIIVGEFHQREEFGPIVLLIIAIDSNVLFQGLICLFGLSVGFRMITRGEMELHIQSCSKRLEEVGYKLGALVGGNVRRNTMFRENMHNAERWHMAIINI